jgi:hypothetical protein
LTVAVALLLMAGAVSHATLAGADVRNFAMSPTSGPPGTSVHVSGIGCAPGILLSSSRDFVQVSSTAGVPTSTRFAVSTNGSWSGSLVVPANAPAGPATVTALCFSDALPSLLTIYLPAVFTVTTGTATTVATTTPTTRPHAGSTVPGSGSPGGSPATAGPGGPGASPADPVSTPGDGTGAVFDGNGGGSSYRGTHSSVGTAPTASQAASAVRAQGAANAARAADLSAPSLLASGDRSSGGLGWLVWLLVILALVGVIAFAAWIYRSRRHTLAPDVPAELQ